MSDVWSGFLSRLGFLSPTQRRLARRRPSIDEARFVQDILESGGDAAVASLIWAHLKDWGYAKGFTPYPDDDLGEVFGLYDEDRDEDLILSLLEQMNIPSASPSAVFSFGEVNTPRRSAIFVEYCRAQSQAV